MKHNTVSINILVDNSHFMRQHAVEAEQELNQLLVEYQNADATVSYSVFADKYQSIFIDNPLNEINSFAIESEGQSALFESACKMIDEVGKHLAAKSEEERPEKVVFVFVTAGQDSVSDLSFSKQVLSPTRFDIRGGSVTGPLHLKPGLPNQDAFLMKRFILTIRVFSSSY